MLNKGGSHSGAVDNVLGIFCKDTEGGNIIRGKTNPSPLSLNCGRKGISIQVENRFVEVTPHSVGEISGVWPYKYW